MTAGHQIIIKIKFISSIIKSTDWVLKMAEYEDTFNISDVELDPHRRSLARFHREVVSHLVSE